MKASISLWTLLLVAQLVCQVPALNIARYSQSPVQYHIQADTGGDRYFRYQTYNGQWRKEKRLRNGKVIGAYGWTDDRGILRLYDYLADEHGYRVVRERTMKVSDGAPQNQLDTDGNSDVKVRAFLPAFPARHRNSNPTFNINDIRRKSYEKARKSLDFSGANDLGTSVQPGKANVEEVAKTSGVVPKQGAESASESTTAYQVLTTQESMGRPSESLAGESGRNSVFPFEESSGTLAENLASESQGNTDTFGEDSVNPQVSAATDASRREVDTIQRNINEVAREFNGKNDKLDRAPGNLNNKPGINNFIPGNNIARSITNDIINTVSEGVDDITQPFSGSNDNVEVDEGHYDEGPYDEFRSKRKSKISDLDRNELRWISKGRKLTTFAGRQTVSGGESHDSTLVRSDSPAPSNYVNSRDSERQASLSTNSSKDVSSTGSEPLDRNNKNASSKAEIKNIVPLGSVKEEESPLLSNVQISSSRPRVSMSRKLRARQHEREDVKSTSVRPKVVRVKAPGNFPVHRKRNSSFRTQPVGKDTLNNSSSSQSFGFNHLLTGAQSFNLEASQIGQNRPSNFSIATGIRSRKPINRLKTRNRGSISSRNHERNILTKSNGNSPVNRAEEDPLTSPHENTLNDLQGYTVTQEHPLTSLEEHLLTNTEKHSLTLTQEHESFNLPQHPLTITRKHHMTSLEEHPLTITQEHPLPMPEQHPITNPATSLHAQLLPPQDMLTQPQLVRQKRKHSRAQSAEAAVQPTINYDTGTMFHFEELAPDGSKKGRHGYVDPLGFLRVTSYVSGTSGHVETRSSRFVGTRNAGDPT